MKKYVSLLTVNHLVFIPDFSNEKESSLDDEFRMPCSSLIVGTSSLNPGSNVQIETREYAKDNLSCRYAYFFKKHHGIYQINLQTQTKNNKDRKDLFVLNIYPLIYL